MSITVRPAHSGDENTIAAQLVRIHDLHAQGRPDLFGGGSAKLDASSLLPLFDDPEHLCLVAEVAGQAAGYLLAVRKHSQNLTLSDFSTLYIDDLFVEESFRHRGIATALMQKAEEFARTAGCYNLTLNVWQFNKGAMALYDRLGFFPQRTIMEKSLS